MTRYRKIDDFNIPVWIHILLIIDSEKGYKSVTSLIKDSRFSYYATFYTLKRLESKGFIVVNRIGKIKKNIPIRLTEKGKEFQKILFFMRNYLKD